MKAKMPKTSQENIAVILSKVTRIEEDIKDVNDKLESNYVTQDQFEPVKNIVYGMVASILLAVVGAIIALVLRKP